MFLFFEVVMLILFGIAFTNKNEILWTLCAFLAGLLSFMAFNIETWAYVFDASIQAYVPTLLNNSYIWLMCINILFFVLAVVFGVYDLYEKLQSNKKVMDFRNSDN